jgi:hypothetical protein
LGSTTITGSWTGSGLGYSPGPQQRSGLGLQVNGRLIDHPCLHLGINPIMGSWAVLYTCGQMRQLPTSLQTILIVPFTFFSIAFHAHGEPAACPALFNGYSLVAFLTPHEPRFLRRLGQADAGVKHRVPPLVRSRGNNHVASMAYGHTTNYVLFDDKCRVRC